MKNLTLKNKYRFGFPKKSGLYDPQFEKDSCGVGLVANIKGTPSREIIIEWAEIYLSKKNFPFKS